MSFSALRKISSPQLGRKHLHEASPAAGTLFASAGTSPKSDDEMTWPCLSFANYCHHHHQNLKGCVVVAGSISKGPPTPGTAQLDEYGILSRRKRGNDGLSIGRFVPAIARDASSHTIHGAFPMGNPYDDPAPGPSMRLDGDADRNPPIGIATRPEKAASRTKEGVRIAVQCSAVQENAVLSCTSVASTIGLTHAQPQPYGLIKAGKAHAPKKRAVSHPATHNSPMG
ncbi:hypothetical protein N5P37_008664 [Trichoderma harzianum]|nr:hypothetical protein N5P37_008664 [Trichoderma harzianum]